MFNVELKCVDEVNGETVVWSSGLVPCSFVVCLVDVSCVILVDDIVPVELECDVTDEDPEVSFEENCEDEETGKVECVERGGCLETVEVFSVETGDETVCVETVLSEDVGNIEAVCVIIVLKCEDGEPVEADSEE